MVEVRIAELDSFEAVGKKVWISGQDNSQFGAFWSACHEDGTIAALRALSKEPPKPIPSGYRGLRRTLRTAPSGSILPQNPMITKSSRSLSALPFLPLNGLFFQTGASCRCRD
ncbi:MAG: hypothetical protein PHI27_11915 [Eubacteriales bacterium]|nr:hypothetical protein [Eubacteriales bacterium]MDD3882936.1 hypothetical protein [Eubacteriales bacterium]MDD4513517.1 hypothetical protein [Eubacteriales bacterium]